MAVLVTAALLLTGCGSASVDSAGPSTTHEFVGTTLEGEPFDGSTLAGSPAVLWFWAPWCPTCRAQQAAVSELAETHDDVRFVGVAGLDEDVDFMAEFAAGTSAEITHLGDSAGEVWRHFGVTAQSTYVVLDAAGTVVAEGYLDNDELRRTVAGLAG